MSNSRISVIIPLYNKEKTIGKTIKSVLSQNFSNFEIIIVNDGSSDRSINKVQEFDDDRITLINKKNGGVSSARNYGVEIAHGDWIVFLDADDLLLKNALSYFNELITNHPNIPFFSCNFFYSNKEDYSLYSNHYYQGVLKNSFFQWLIGRFMPRTGASIYKKSLLQIHPFNEKIHRYEDAEVLFNIMRSTKIYCSNTPVMVYNLDELEASKKRKDISSDFLGHLSFEKKNFWERVLLFKLLLEALELYPNEAKRIYSNFYYRIDYSILLTFSKVIKKITTLYR